MHLKTLTTLSVAASMALSALLVTGPAIAASHAMSIEEAVASRQADMKAMGGAMRTLGSLEGEAMENAATIYVDVFAGLADKFPVGSDIEGSRALPAIWDDADGFSAVIATAAGVAADMMAAAEAGDQAAFGAAAQALGPVCGQCHSTYRSGR